MVAGGISADMHASAHLALAVQPDGTIGVTVSDVTAVVGPLVPQFTGPDGNTLDGFITVGNNDFRTLVENLVQQQLIPTFTDRIPPLLEQLLGATDKLLDNVSFSLDSKLGTPVTLTLDGTVGALDVVPGPAVGFSPGHVTVRQAVSITTSATTPVHPTSRGALRVSANAALPADARLGPERRALGGLAQRDAALAVELGPARRHRLVRRAVGDRQREAAAGRDPDAG